MGSLNITSALGSFTTIKESNSTVTKENGHAEDNKKKPDTIIKKGRAILGRSCSNKDRTDTKLVAKEDDIKIAKEGPKTVTEKGGTTNNDASGSSVPVYRAIRAIKKATRS